MINLKDVNIGHFGDSMEHYCRSCKIHEVCLTCALLCKDVWRRWSGTMPPSEYCESYVEHPLWTIIRLMADQLEGN